MLNRTDTIASFAKGLRVLECFGAEHPRRSVSEVAAATGLDRATARRCLLTLHAEGYASYDGKYFALTPQALRLGMSALNALPLPQRVQPWLDQLSEQIGQSCSVAILDETEIVYIARAAQRRVMSIGLMPGSRLPAHATSMGRVLLASLAEAEARELIARADLTPRTPKSLTDPDDIMESVRAAHRNGYCLIDEEVETGLRAIAVPVLDGRGRTVAALNTGMAVTRAPAESLIETYLPALLKVQQNLKRIV